MKAKHAVLSLFAIGFAGAALAGVEPYPESVLVQSGSTTSRAEVIAEMQSAGTPSVGEEGFRFAESSGHGRSRAEVVAELEEAQRLGLLTIGEGDVKFATAEQEQMIADAGRRASGSIQVAGK
jgi:hypothetical protein